MSGQALADWTTGAEAIVYQSCTACGGLQYFRRSFCAACGAPDPVEKRASGQGTVYATSLVCRAATPETRAHVPYNIVLVDTSEGFRMMAHGDNDLAIGDKVTARFAPFAGRIVPYFEKMTMTFSYPPLQGRAMTILPHIEDKLAMTSIAVTASICATASEAALLVASFMPISLAHDRPSLSRLAIDHASLNDARERAFGHESSLPWEGLTTQIFLLGTPHDEYSL